MILNKEEARDIVYEDHEDFEKVEENCIDQERWSVVYEGIFKQKSTGKFYKVVWSVGATECQEERPFEYEKEVEFIEVEPYEKLVVVWRKI